MSITDIILDFDGTCTQIPAIQEPFLAEYLVGLNNTVFAGNQVTKQEWVDAQQLVQEHSPQAAWTFGVTPAAPAAADPYILAYESAMHLLRRKGIKMSIPGDVFSGAATLWPAPWRNEARNVLETLLQHNITVTFISNSSSVTIQNRLKELFIGNTSLAEKIFVRSDAEKYKIAELAWDTSIPPQTAKHFKVLSPVIHPDAGIHRPVYLRRGPYFEAICTAFSNHLNRLHTTVFCGDIWEMDLAMPYALGANIHLVERAQPFETYAYELKAVLNDPKRGKISEDLHGLLTWIS